MPVPRAVTSVRISAGAGIFSTRARARPYAGAERGDERADLGGGQHLVHPRPLHVQDLALERQDGLEHAVAALLGGAAGAIALHQEELALGGVLLLAVGELAGQGRDVERVLAPHLLPRQLRRPPRGGGQAPLAR